jgi:hypothetical protein
MAPSALSTELASNIVTKGNKVDIIKEESHVHGAKELTPLEAISHGDLVIPGNASFL